MRWGLGPIPEDRGFTPARGGWAAVREPNPWLTQLLALPIGIGTGFGLALAFGAWTSVQWLHVSGVGLVAVLLLAIPVHEAVHAWLHPGGGRTDRTVVGFWPRAGIFYAHYEGEMSRARFLATLAGPFVALSILPLALALAGATRGELAYLSILNGMCACGDLFGFLVVLVQIPPGVTVRNKGWRTYWRRPALRMNESLASP